MMEKLNLAAVIDIYHGRLKFLNRAKMALVFERGLRIYVGRDLAGHIDVQLSVGDDDVGAYGKLMADARFDSKYECTHVFIGPDDTWERCDLDDDSPASDAEIDRVIDYLNDQGVTMLYDLLERYDEEFEQA